MRLRADDAALASLMSRAGSLAERQAPLPASLRAALDPLDGRVLAGSEAASAVDRFVGEWSPVLEQYARDARGIVDVLRAVDRAYVATEMDAAARFGASS